MPGVVVQNERLEQLGRFIEGARPIVEGRPSDVSIEGAGRRLRLSGEDFAALAGVVQALLDDARDADEEISPNEAADILGVSRPTVMRMIRKGVFRTRKKNTHHVLYREEVMAHRAEQDAASRAALQALVDFDQDNDI